MNIGAIKRREKKKTMNWFQGARGTYPYKNGQHASRKAELKPRRD